MFYNGHAKIQKIEDSNSETKGWKVSICNMIEVTVRAYVSIFNFIGRNKRQMFQKKKKKKKKRTNGEAHVSASVDIPYHAYFICND